MRILSKLVCVSVCQCVATLNTGPSPKPQEVMERAGQDEGSPESLASACSGLPAGSSQTGAAIA